MRFQLANVRVTRTGPHDSPRGYSGGTSPLEPTRVRRSTSRIVRCVQRCLLSVWPSWECRFWGATYRNPTRPGAIRRRIKFAGSRSIRQFDWKCWTGRDQARRSSPYDPPLPDPTTVPRPLKPTPEPDRSSFNAFTKRSGLRVTFREAEWRQQFAENPDGSVGQSLLNFTIRHAITVDARVKPNYAGIRVPVLAMYQAQRPFEEVAAEYDIRNEQERAALRQQYTAIRTMYTRWQQDLLAAIPTARIVELPGANLFMFLSNEADVLREIRAFAATLPK
jgi:uncharacterized protein (DUF433 family)